MPELPELTVWARQAHEELAGKTVAAVETPQPKCLNVTPAEMAALVAGRTVLGVRERGKWMIVDLAAPAGPAGSALDSHLLLNLGMGGEFYYHRPVPAKPAPGKPAPGTPAPEQPAPGKPAPGTPAPEQPAPGKPAPGEPMPAGELPAEEAATVEPAPPADPARTPGKYQFKLSFTDGSELAIRFWWFGYAHAARAGELARHTMTANLGPSPLDPDMDLARFGAMVAARPRRSAKSFLMDQKVLAGIGNVYAQDSLWGAGLHPDRPLGSLSEAEVSAFWLSVRRALEQSIAKGGLAYERDFFGRPGGLTNDDFAVGYRAGKPCPKCGTAIQKIRTGSTSTYICPNCQKV